MAYEPQDNQYSGRQNPPPGGDAQGAGRGGTAQPHVPPPSNAPYTQQGYTPPNYTPPPSYTPPPIFPPSPVKSKSKKGLIIGIIAGLFLLAIVIGIISQLGRDSQGTGKTQDAGESPSWVPRASESSSPADPATAPATEPATPDQPETPVKTVGEGEYLYTGHLELNNVGDIEVSFVLSADLSYIYDITVTVRDLEASQQNGNMTTTVTVSNMTQTYSEEFPVDFERDNHEIVLDKSVITSLRFAGDFVFIDLYYVYHSAGVGGGSDTEIPIGVAHGILYTDVMPTLPVTEPPATPEEPPTPSTQTVFDTAKLKNWNLALEGGIHSFSPAYPEPRHYIVAVTTVIDPVTGRESEGGYENNYARHMPFDTDNVLWYSGKLRDGGLILTDDPDQATYALIVTFVYDHTGTFKFNDGSVVTQYHGTTQAELRNLVTGESIYTIGMTTYATYANESVYTAMLDNAKGKQLYAESHTVTASDFDDYWEFIGDLEG